MYMPNVGYILEGTLEQDPITDRFQLRTVTSEGKPITLDVNKILGEFQGKPVKLTVANLETLQRMMAELGPDLGVSAVMPEDLETKVLVPHKLG